MGWKLTAWGFEWGQDALAQPGAICQSKYVSGWHRMASPPHDKGRPDGTPSVSSPPKKLEDEFAPESEALESSLTGVRYIEEGRRPNIEQVIKQCTHVVMIAYVLALYAECKPGALKTMDGRRNVFFESHVPEGLSGILKAVTSNSDLRRRPTGDQEMDLIGCNNIQNVGSRAAVVCRQIVVDPWNTTYVTPVNANSTNRLVGITNEGTIVCCTTVSVGIDSREVPRAIWTRSHLRRSGEIEVARERTQ